ncbi:MULTISPECIES: 23S rRNA (guanosine(2251)-2'-O)-methyltransferase RlmB [Calditerrivibrio]|jgi:23S rRNA (guanosine2251-2'-O)-methyltransferase|uniref:23S rRNA (Guanosine(2251)-2'-O)-methyltransferase RlmB n=1 Tax=Calditerrivibrio nitroreducens TaxID=477976 RepID=A0A2J6WPU3_9BACT|nr:MAG: 23S rRNA (guanosine(2251)-2'-O)-methyltransferase RlmB [Calditerrivibrio nitroreducens]
MSKMIFYGKNPFFEALNGEKIIKAYIRNDDRIKDLLIQKKIPFEELPSDKHKERFGKDAQGYAFEFEVEYYEIDEIGLNAGNVCILDHIQDPQNFGAIIRAGHCFGVKNYIIAKDNQSPVTPAVVKSSAGSAIYSRFYKVVNINRSIEELKKKGYWVYAADMNGEVNLVDITPNEPYAVIIGSEGEGIRKNVLKKADVVFRIPMKGMIDSLNASQSAAISFYHFYINSKM